MKCLILILALSFVSFGQTKFENELLKKSTDQLVIRTYDKFKDRTVVRSPTFTVNSIKTGKTQLGTGVVLLLVFPGSRIESAKIQYYIVVTEDRAKGQRLDSEATILADGARTTLKSADASSKTLESKGLSILFGSSVYVEEQESFLIDRNALASVLAAKTVEMQVGQVEFALRKLSMDVFRKMLAITDK